MLVNQAKFVFWEAAQPDIFHDATFKNLIQFLMDHGDALFQSLFWVVKAYGLAIEFDTTGVLDIDTEETFHHSWFTSTVLTHEGVNGTRANFKSCTVQGFDPWKLLDDIFNIQ